MEKYIVKLNKEERQNLLSLIKKGKAAAYKLTHARILLEADEAEKTRKKKTDIEIAGLLYTSAKTVKRIRKRFVEEGMEIALSRRPHSKTRIPKINGEVEAHLIALSCSSPPEGRSRWTLKLLSDRLVEMKIVDSVSSATVRRAFKKNELKVSSPNRRVNHLN